MNADHVQHDCELRRIQEVAKVCNVSVVTMRRWISKGLLPTIKIGAVVRIRASDLEAFLSARTTSPMAAQS